MTYWKTRPRDPTETLVGSYKNWKTGTLDPSGTIAGPYKNQKIGTLVGPYKKQKSGSQDSTGSSTLKIPESGTQYPNETLTLVVGAY